MRTGLRLAVTEGELNGMLPDEATKVLETVGRVADVEVTIEPERDEAIYSDALGFIPRGASYTDITIRLRVLGRASDGVMYVIRDVEEGES